MSVQKKPLPRSYWIFVVCVIITLCIAFLPFGESETERAVFFGAFYKPFIIAGEVHRLLTCGFIHVSVLHLFVNLFSLSILSRAMENYLGVWKFLLILFGSVIGGSIFLFCTAGNTVGVGLSGGLYGLLAGYVFTIYEAGGMKIPQVRTGVMQTIVINLFINFMPGVAWQAHLGGAITGLLLLMAFQPRRSDKKALLHARIALVLLLIGSGFAMIKKSAIPEGERYLLTDLRVLQMEKQIGLEGHARAMAKRLDALYDVTYLETMLEED